MRDALNAIPDSPEMKKIFEAMNKPLGTNPKDVVGSTKVSITKLPSTAIIHGSHAMVDGGEKYGPYNWRENKVIASIYIDAAMRHLMAWFEGQEIAADSEVHHLGHAIACCGILLDAQETGNLVDDRPVCGDPDVADRLLTRLAGVIKRRKEAKTQAAKVPQKGTDIGGFVAGLTSANPKARKDGDGDDPNFLLSLIGRNSE